MRFASVVVTAAAVLWGTAAAIVSARGPQDRSTAAVPAAPGPAASTPLDRAYVGSKACADCHGDEHRQWSQSLHVQMTKPVAEATVLGDFRDGTRFSDHGRAFEFGTRDGRPFVRVRAGDRLAETFTVDYTLGAKRFQGYLSTLPDGRIYVLPAFWHIESRRWIDWKEITPVPDGAHDLRQIWNSNCFNCHATNLTQGFDVSTKTFRTAWTEMGIGCEACHGPGQAHVTMMAAWKQDPAQKPGLDRLIFSPAAAPPRQGFDTCAYCHGNKVNAFVGFAAGDRYEDFAMPFLVSGTIPSNDRQGEFWPDGRPNRFNRPQALMQSGCFQANAVTCSTCHAAHGSANPFSLKVNVEQGREGDRLCVQCHDGNRGRPVADRATTPMTIAADVITPRVSAPRSPMDAVPWTDAELEAHTHHRADSDGSRCVSCHMSDVNLRILVRRRDHTFAPPVPEITAGFGVPNACTTCHDERPPEWAAAQMDRWWGDGTRRASTSRVADLMYRAGSGDRTTLPALARLAVDRRNGPLLRASAVDHMRQLLSGPAAASRQSQTSFGAATTATPPIAPMAADAGQVGPEVVNAVIGAAADAEAIVRASAVRLLALFDGRPQVLTALTARLVDQARLVRIAAAESLLTLGVATLPGRAGELLATAQDELVLGLGTFPEDAANHVAIGWVESERGRTAAAEQALANAVALDPTLARPFVIRGVLAARDRRFDDAIVEWERARKLEPAYPNLDRLIAEARTRK